MKLNVLKYPSVQAALDDADDSDVVYLPSSKVYEAPAGGLRIRKAIEFRGDGPGRVGDDSGTVLVPHDDDDDVVVVDPTDGSLENVYLHDFKVTRKDAMNRGRDGVRCITADERKVTNLRIERVLATDLGGVGFALLGTNGGPGAVVNPRLYECVAAGCAGGGALLMHCALGNVAHCRFKGNGMAMTGSFGLKSMSGGVAVYACVLDGNLGTGGQLWLLDSLARVDATRFRDFASASPPVAALVLERCPGTVVGASFFELASVIADSVGIEIVSDPQAGPMLVLCNRFKGVEHLVSIREVVPGEKDVRGLVVLPQFDETSSGDISLPEDTNRGLVAVPHMNRPASNALAGLALPSDEISAQDPTCNQTDGMLAYRSSKFRAYSTNPPATWQTVRIGPAPVKDLQIRGRGRHSLAVGWTAPKGGATEYRLKRSYSPITDANFDSATDVPGVPPPSPPGSDECVVDSGLLECKLHYYALKSVDAQGRESAISNLVSSSTFCSGSIEAECL